MSRAPMPRDYSMTGIRYSWRAIWTAPRYRCSASSTCDVVPCCPPGFKRVGEGDTGPNTGGMALCAVALVPDDVYRGSSAGSSNPLRPRWFGVAVHSADCCMSDLR